MKFEMQRWSLKCNCEKIWSFKCNIFCIQCLIFQLFTDTISNAGMTKCRLHWRCFFWSSKCTLPDGMNFCFMLCLLCFLITSSVIQVLVKWNRHPPFVFQVAVRLPDHRFARTNCKCYYKNVQKVENKNVQNDWDGI